MAGTGPHCVRRVSAACVVPHLGTVARVSVVGLFGMAIGGRSIFGSLGQHPRPSYDDGIRDHALIAALAVGEFFGVVITVFVLGAEVEG